MWCGVVSGKVCGVVGHLSWFGAYKLFVGCAMLCCHFRGLLAQLRAGEHQREFQATSGSFGWGLEGFTIVRLPGNALLLLGLPQGVWKVVYWAVVPPTHTHTHTHTDRHKERQTDTQ